MLALKDACRVPLIPAALILAAATVIAGCGAATPRTSGTGLTAVAHAPRARAGTPPVFAATLDPRHGQNSRVGLFSSATGRLVRWLDRPPRTVSDVVLGVRAGWVYFTQWRASAPPDVARVPLTGGRARIVRTGTADYALSPDGRMAAYVATVPRRHATENTEIVVMNLRTGHRHTIVMVTGQPVAGSQIGVTNLAWAPGDIHLAVEVRYAAFASDVLVFNARTARDIADGRKAPCPGGCAAKYPGYLSTGALTYLADRLGGTGPNAITLVSWAGGHQTKRLATVKTGGGPIIYGESATPQGAAIWARTTYTRTGYAIWRWSGGAPVRLSTPPPPGFTGLFGIAW